MQGALPAPSPSAIPFPPVDGLRDIALPEPVGVFPLAPAWYLLAALLLALVAWAAYLYLKRRAAFLYRREALAELEAIAAALDGKGGRIALAARLPELLKRVALQVEPRAAVASLSDARWLGELDRLYGGDGFSKGPGRFLPVLAYGSAGAVAALPRAEIDALVRLCRHWIAKHARVS
jgi:hypothetical protein